MTTIQALAAALRGEAIYGQSELEYALERGLEEGARIGLDYGKSEGVTQALEMMKPAVTSALTTDEAIRKIALESDVRYDEAKDVVEAILAFLWPPAIEAENVVRIDFGA